MKSYDLIIIGFGKAGKTLAACAAKQGKTVAVIEKDKKMYGGTCINIGCIPSKTLIVEGKKTHDFIKSMTQKTNVVTALNKANYNNLAQLDGVTVIDATAQFESNDKLNLIVDGEVTETITATNIIINTGATSIMPSIDGIDYDIVYDSESIMELQKQPKSLVIIGGGYISLEFAAMYSEWGTKVTILERSSEFIQKEDREVAQEVLKDFNNKGIEVVFNVETKEIQKDGTVITSKGNYRAEAVLVATGRKPNTSSLRLENTDIEVGKHGEVIVNEHLVTKVPNIYAAGDVTGGMQFTYLSLDDFRIIKDQLYGNKERTTKNRGHVPYTVFITPSLSRVGLIATEAIEQGYEIREGKLPVKSIPRNKVNDEALGLFKVVIDKKTNYILGATLYGDKSEELINIIKLAMDQHITYDVLRDNIYTHPTMAESFNTLFEL